MRNTYNYLVVVYYIPPENSKYSSLEAFNEIESELIQLSFGCDYFSLIGDFNAKTGDTQDYISLSFPKCSLLIYKLCALHN
jgi:hypothetical protein